MNPSDNVTVTVTIKPAADAGTCLVCQKHAAYDTDAPTHVAEIALGGPKCASVVRICKACAPALLDKLAVGLDLHPFYIDISAMQRREQLMQKQIAELESANVSLERANVSKSDRIAELEALEITADWQDAVRDAFIHAGVPDHVIAGSGSDADPFELTLTEIHQGIGWFLQTIDAETDE